MKRSREKRNVRRYTIQKLVLALFSIGLLLMGSGSVNQAIGQSGTASGPVIQSQPYPTGYFRSPLNIPHQASGTFGELRSTHFHAGDDYRTQQKVGLPLFAVAEGFVSRIRIQIGGGGHALYIDHPNGYTSVYLHMHEFAPKLAARVLEDQYAQQRFDVDMRLEPHEFPVKKGERIGLAGNTGSSQGPHLHFEIRDTETQDPLNPQLFGLHFPDNIPPLIHGITVYDLGEYGFDEQTPRRHFKTRQLGPGRYQLVHSGHIPVNGRIGLGIETVDRHNGTSFNHGVYSIELLDGSEPISTVVFERLSYDWSGAIHSYIDYPYFVEAKTRVQKSFRDPGSPVGLYRYLAGDGSMKLHPGETTPKKLTYRVRDFHGNTSTISFEIRSDEQYTPQRPQEAGTVRFRFNQPNRFEAENIRIRIPEGALYNDLYLHYSQGPQPQGGYSLTQQVHNPRIPLFKSYELEIRADQALPQELVSKALIVDERGRSHGGVFRDGFVRTTTRAFGTYHIRLDTVPPRIQPLNIAEGKRIAGQARLNFRISDDLSGIASFNGYLNGEWVLMEYDPKNNALWHRLSPDLQRGNHRFRLVVRDGKDNEQVYEVNFLR